MIAVIICGTATIWGGLWLNCGLLVGVGVTGGLGSCLRYESFCGWILGVVVVWGGGFGLVGMLWGGGLGIKGLRFGFEGVLWLPYPLVGWGFVLGLMRFVRCSLGLT